MSEPESRTDKRLKSHNIGRFRNGPSMQLDTLLTKKKGEILKQWFDHVINTYPEDTAAIYKQKKDPFANPVGGTIRSGLEAIIDQLAGKWEPEVMHSLLDPIIRIRAIQNFKPSEAVSFVLALKPIIRKIANKSEMNQSHGKEILAFEADVDRLNLLAFDIYVACREKIYDLKANEIRNRTLRAFERANLLVDESVER